MYNLCGYVWVCTYFENHKTIIKILAVAISGEQDAQEILTLCVFCGSFYLFFYFLH